MFGLFGGGLFDADVLRALGAGRWGTPLSHASRSMGLGLLNRFHDALLALLRLAGAGLRNNPSGIPAGLVCRHRGTGLNPFGKKVLRKKWKTTTST